jgi:hypothetical protein
MKLCLVLRITAMECMQEGCFRSILLSMDLCFQMQQLFPSTPLTGRRYLKSKEMQHNVTPVSTATQSVGRLQTLLAGRQASPSETLLELFRFVLHNIKNREDTYAYVKVSLCLITHHALKTWGSGGNSSTSLDITRLRQVIIFMPLLQYPKEHPVPVG